MSMPRTARAAAPPGTWPRFRGVLQVDGYAGFKRLAGIARTARCTLAFCWAHMRRGFYEFYVSTKSPLAAEVLARIRELYAIEAEIRGHPAEHRRQVRQERSRPDRRGSACLVAGSRSARLRRLRSGEGHALCDAALARPDRVPRRRPRRDGHERGRAGDPTAYPHAQKCVVRGLRWRGRVIGRLR